MPRADFPHKKVKAVPVRPIFKVKCSTCPNFVRLERQGAFEPKINAIEVMRVLRDEHGWMWVSFGLVYCPHCRPTHRTFPDPDQEKAPEIRLPEPIPEPDEEGVVWY